LLFLSVRLLYTRARANPRVAGESTNPLGAKDQHHPVRYVFFTIKTRVGPDG
jgi:hypothetical protein